MIIAFCGPSSSGKSTLIEVLRKSPYFRNKKVVLKAEDQFALIEILRKLFGEKFSVYKESKFFEGTKSKGWDSQIFSFLASLFYPLVVYLEFLFEYLYYEVLFKNKLLLRDRYIYDYSITFEKVLKIHNFLSQYLFEKFPKPYLLFFLKINLATSLKRNKNKVEGKLTSGSPFHQEVLLAYSRIAKAKDLLAVDTNNGIDQPLGEVMCHITAKERLLKVPTISLSGLDGSGKTTIASLLCEYARKLGVSCEVVSIYYSSFIHKLAGGMMKKTVDIQSERGSFFKALITFLMSYVQYTKPIAIRRPHLVIFDRFFYDYLVNFELLGVRWLGFFKRLTPRVDKSFLLYINPRIAYRRKKEGNYGYYSRSAKLFTKVSKEYDIKIVDRNGQSPKTTIREIVASL